MARPRILIAEPTDFSPVARARLETIADVVLDEVPPAQLSVRARDFDVLWFRLAHRVDAAFLQGNTRLKIVATPVTGIDHLDLAACAAARVKVVSLKGEVDFLKNIRATAEMTLALALGLLRHLPQAANSVLAGEWKRDLFRGRELAGKTVGLVGVGRLGELVAPMFAAFGCRVWAFDPRADFPPGIERAASLEALLAGSDLVSLHVNYAPSTHHLIGSAQLKAMKPGSWLINTSRGGVVDEAALLTALEQGHIAGAALDVLSGEPQVDLRHPVVAFAKTHSNVLVVPHIGGNTVESFEKTELFLAGRVLEALS